MLYAIDLQIMVNIAFYAYFYTFGSSGLLQVLDSLTSENHVCAAAGVPLASIHRQPVYALMITGIVGTFLGLDLLMKPSSKLINGLKFVFLVACPFLMLVLWTSLMCMIPFSNFTNDKVNGLDCDEKTIFLIHETGNQMGFLAFMITLQMLFTGLFQVCVIDQTKDEDAKPEIQKCLLSKESVEQKA